MPLSKLNFRPGINKEVTRYSAEGGWYDCDKVRFRQGFPEKIGGWERISENTFLGVCRSLFTWLTLTGTVYRGLGTHLKFYVESLGAYYDITPIRLTTIEGSATFACSSGSSELVVTDANHGATTNDFVTFSQAESLAGTNVTATVLNKEYQIQTIVDGNTYTVTLLDANNQELIADADGSGGGSLTEAEYQINTGAAINSLLSGWSAGTWSQGEWGRTSSLSEVGNIRLWSQSNFGEDLIFCHRQGALFYWDSSNELTNRAVRVDSLTGANQVPLTSNLVLVSDVSRFVFCFGTNDIFSSDFDPMVIRWSDQESLVEWQPSATNQAGSIRLSKGSQIITATQARQEILVWTDEALYSLQYVGPPIVWSSQIVGIGITISSMNSVVYVNGSTYWMGKNNFYMYNGRVESLPCTLQRHVFENINKAQLDQIFVGTNEEFYEIWWFYPSSESETIDKYVVFNYKENIWYHGSMARTAWERKFNRILACGYNGNIIEHEIGVDDGEGETSTAIQSYITSSETDIGDGDKFSFIWRLLPDLTFVGSSYCEPSARMTLYGLKNSGSGYNNPASEGGSNTGLITKQAICDVEQYTEQLNIRIRGRQIVLKVESDELGVKWQLGSPRIDIRPDGRR